jgi:toxin secretion/phage lysis holin
MLLVVAVRLDILLGTTYVRDAVCIGFCCNELISIIENTGLMGVNYPQTLKDAIELLQGKSK